MKTNTIEEAKNNKIMLELEDINSYLQNANEVNVLNHSGFYTQDIVILVCFLPFEQNLTVTIQLK